MPKKLVGDINIMYEAYGKGATIVYLQSVLGGINPAAYYFAGRLSSHFRVIIWDSPNTRHSDVVIKPFPSDCHLTCEYLKGLLDELGEDMVHIAGCSGGGDIGLLFTSLYPEMVKSLAMYRPTDTTSSAEKELVKARYLNLAEYAKVHCMEEVVAYSQNPPKTRFGDLSGWIASLYRKDSQKILSLDNKEFSEMLSNWGKWMASPMFYRANLSDDDLQNIKVPVLIAPCADEYHPESIALDLHEHLPNSVYIPSKMYRSVDEIYDAKWDENPFGGLCDFVDEYEGFMCERFI